MKEHHLHIEGAVIDVEIKRKLALRAAVTVDSNYESKQNFVKLTSINPREALLTLDRQTTTPFSFEQFLQKLYLTKLLLCSSSEIASAFVREVLKNEIDKAGGSFTAGLTPTIPSDFPHLNRKEWNSSIVNAIHDAVKKTSSKPTIVLETKRQHLLNGYYKQTLEFLTTLTKEIGQKANIAIGLGDNAAKTPLTNRHILEQYSSYIREAKEIHSGVQIQIHQLEQSSCPTKCLKDEFEKVLSLFRENNYRNITWIHMGNLHKIASPMENLKQIADRGDKIVICYSSNKYLQNDFLLDDKDVFSYITKNQPTNIMLGTDDPLVFNTTSVQTELKKIEAHLLKIGRNKEDVKTVTKLLENNS